MKTNVPVRKRTVRLLPLVATLIVSSLCYQAQASGNHSAFSDTILIKKQTTNKKIKVKLYPSASSEVLFFSASGDAGKVYQLFLFDLDGKLIKQVNIRNKQTTVLNHIDKGNYQYEVFSDDERIENGQLIVK